MSRRSKIDPRIKDRTKIYLLLEEGKPRYVGKSHDPSVRLVSHLSEARRGGRDYRCNWIRKLLRNGLLPVQRILEIVPEGVSWQDRERYWIRYFKKRGYSLVNTAAGGKGGCGRAPGFRHSKETCKKISEAQIGKKISEECRRKLSIAHMGKRATEETKKKLSKMRQGISTRGKGWTQPEEAKKKISLARAGISQRGFGFHHSDETRRKMSLSHRNLCAEKA